MGAAISNALELIIVRNALLCLPFAAVVGTIGGLAAWDAHHSSGKRSTSTLAAQFHPLTEDQIPEACSGYSQSKSGAFSATASGADAKEMQKEVSNNLRQVFDAADPAALPQGLFAVERDGMVHIGYREPAGYAPIAEKAAAEAGWTFDVHELLGNLDAFNARYDNYCLSQVDAQRQAEPVHKLNVLLDEYTTYLNETVESIPVGVMVPQENVQIAKYEDLMAAYGGGSVGATAAPALEMIA